MGWFSDKVGWAASPSGPEEPFNHRRAASPSGPEEPFNHRRAASPSYFLLLLFLLGCKPDAPPPSPPPPAPDPPALDAASAFEEVKQFVDLGPKTAGTAEAETAAKHIFSRLQTSGVEARIDSFTDKAPGGHLPFHNVVATIRGEGTKWILLGSHFDTKRGISEAFTGANDSASSTGLLIELARSLQKAAAAGKLPINVECVWFDGEECAVHYGRNDGFHGSKYHAGQIVINSRKSLYKAVIVLDMIGDKDLGVTIPPNSTSELIVTAYKAAEKEGVRKYFTMYGSGIIDDHVPFLDVGIPAVDLIDFNYGSGPGRNDYWHTDEDTIDKISAESLDKVGRVALRMVFDLATP